MQEKETKENNIQTEKKIQAREETLSFIEERKLIPVVRTSTAESAENAAKALVDGGVKLIEVSLNVPNAFRVIEGLSKMEGIVVGAGTVLDGESAFKAFNAGARFIVSPHTESDVVRVTQNAGAVVIQGALTPTEMMEAYRLGVDAFKVFPIHVFDGPRYIKLVKEPLPFLKLIPSGGVSQENMEDYLQAGVCGLILGSAVLDRSLVRAGKWAEITERAKSFTEKLDQYKQTHKRV